MKDMARLYQEQAKRRVRHGTQCVRERVHVPERGICSRAIFSASGPVRGAVGRHGRRVQPQPADAAKVHREYSTGAEPVVAIAMFFNEPTNQPTPGIR